MKFAAANGITGELLVKGGTRAHLTLAPPLISIEHWLPAHASAAPALALARY